MRVGLAAAVVAAALVPAHAWATNGMRPRTLPTFELEECLTIVDGDLHVDFSIPFEDATLGPDELADSRTLQFFALCRDQHAELEKLPNWIAQDDVDRSLASEVISMPAPDADVLDANADWMACATRLVPDDARLPITCAGTRNGIDFDAGVMAPGNYVVRGYTFEPAVNVWVARRGVVQVRDGDAVLPVVSLMSPPRDDWQAYEADGFDIVGCMDGPAGTPVRIEWASLIALEWKPLADLDVAEGTFSIHFDFPPDAVGQPLIFRGIAGSGAEEWIGYAPGTLLVLPGDGETYDAEPPPGIDFCDAFPDAPDDDESSSSGSGDGSTTVFDPDTDTDAVMQGSARDGGCACRAGRGSSHAVWLFAIALGAFVRRRRVARSRARNSMRAVGGRSRAVRARVAAV